MLEIFINEFDIFYTKKKKYRKHNKKKITNIAHLFSKQSPRHQFNNKYYNLFAKY